MKNKWINIRIETKTREFQSKALLTYNLISRGYGVVVKNELGGNVSRFPIGVYLINSMYADAHARLKQIEQYGNKIYVLDEEGLVRLTAKEYLKRQPGCNMKLITKFLCYGEDQFEVMKKGFPQYEEKLLITGNPRINLLDNKFRLIEALNVERIKKQHGKYILIASNFASVNLLGSKESRDERYKKRYNNLITLNLINNEEDEVEFKNRFEHYNSIFESFLSLVKKIGEDCPHVKVIIRPHPSEDDGIWKSVAKNYDNVEVIYEGNLTEWIKASQLVIQNGCTSAIESLLLNTPCISYRPIIDEKYDTLLPSKLSVNLFDDESVLDVIQKVQGKGQNIFIEENIKFKQLLKRYISFEKEDESVKEIIKVIEMEDVKSYYFNSIIYKIKMFKPHVILPKVKKTLKRKTGIAAYVILDKLNIRNNRLYKWLDKKFLSIQSSERYRRRKLSYLKVQDFESIFQSFNEIYNKNVTAKIKKIDKDTFIISCFHADD